MELTLVLSAVIFTLLAVAVATLVLRGSWSVGESPNPPRPSAAGAAGASAPAAGLEPPGPGHKAPDHRRDTVNHHWDVRKCVASEEAHSHSQTEELSEPAERSSSAPTGLEGDTASEASSGRSQGSSIGVSDQEHLKCPFPLLQSQEAPESPGINDKVESHENGSLKYIPGKARSHHLEMMMSKEELEEEQRVQREQLAAIFQLLKDNKDTFGEVLEGDLEEQLRLYSI